METKILKTEPPQLVPYPTDKTHVISQLRRFLHEVEKLPPDEIDIIIQSESIKGIGGILRIERLEHFGDKAHGLKPAVFYSLLIK